MTRRFNQHVGKHAGQHSDGRATATPPKKTGRCRFQSAMRRALSAIALASALPALGERSVCAAPKAPSIRGIENPACVIRSELVAYTPVKLRFDAHRSPFGVVLGGR